MRRSRLLTYDPAMIRYALFLLLVLILVGCGKPPAFAAVNDGRIALGVTESAVVAAAGQPKLILARSRVETFYYRYGERAVSVTFLGGKVVAFHDADTWPAEAYDAAKDASRAVSLGDVRVGMTEMEVRAKLGDPDGITAKNGQETLHWLGGDDVDSVVHLYDGKVVGFWDRPVSEYTQNVPSSGDRKKATTGGRIRVGMTVADVERALGDPDGKKGAKGVTTYRYETNPIFGDNILYFVGFRDGKVVDLHEFNVTRDKDKKEADAQAQAAAAEQREQRAESSISSILDNPLVKSALGAALGAAADGGSAKVEVKETETVESAKRTLTINGVKYMGGAHLGKPCSFDSPCPSDYKCVMVTDTSGMCAQ